MDESVQNNGDHPSDPLNGFRCRIGLGHDTHRLTKGRPLVIGGVAIPYERGLFGHSDADILLHAIIDALLGAAGLGDIGEHFPDTSKSYEGIKSAELLSKTLDMVRVQGWHIVNLDCTVHAERPKLKTYKPTIRENLSRLLGLPADAINIKAKTGEQVGPVGREEAMSADAIVLLARNCKSNGGLELENQAESNGNASSRSREEGTSSKGLKTPMSLRVYNTLSRQKEDFQTTIPGKVSMYLCGPTVYKPAHIGHMIGPVIFDTVKRYLQYLGYQVTWVVNITDVDDKLIAGAEKRGTTVETLAREMTQDYFDNLATMGVRSIDHFPKATDYINEMQGLIQRLIDQGYAYALDGDVYFYVSKDADYGKLSRRRVEEMLAGTRVEANDQKRNPADFALWKKSRPGEPAWESPWGKGRPGWHIECSAMSMKLLGETIDIHGGGIDLLFPHHENELAQSESCSGKPFVKYWLHNGLMQAGKSSGKVGGQHDRHGEVVDQQTQEANKLAGSKGAASVKDLFKLFSPETIRFFLLSTHYRSPIDFSEENIATSGKSIEGFHRLFETYERIAEQSAYQLQVSSNRSQSHPIPSGASPFLTEVAGLRQKFWEAMDDDFNTGGAIGNLFELRKLINGFVSEQKLETPQRNPAHVGELTTAVTVLRELSSLLGVFEKPLEVKSAGDDGFTNSLMELILEIRAEARKTKNFPVSDKIRDRLNQLKVVVEDRPEGTIWKRT